MSKYQWFKLLLIDRKELAFQILAVPIRKEIARRTRLHKKYKHLYERLKELRSFTLD